MAQIFLLPPPRQSGRTRSERVAALVADLERLARENSSGDGLLWRWSLTGIEVDDLRFCRRQFALRYHPDLAQDEGERAEATRRISRANAVLDAAIAEAKNA